MRGQLLKKFAVNLREFLLALSEMGTIGEKKIVDRRDMISFLKHHSGYSLGTKVKTKDQVGSYFFT